MRNLMALILMFSTGLTGYAQNEYLDTLKLEGVVITGTKYPIPIEKSGKTIYKLTSQDIEHNAGKTVADLLNEVPGIQVDGNFGAPGTNLSYFVRGGSNQQTLILIDGTPINDPSGISLSYDLRQLSANQIESIEILKGGLSTLYGTGASAAVINITLKKSSDESLKGSVGLNGGSFGTFGQTFNVGGTQEGLSYFLSGSNTSSEGFSAAKSQDASIDFDDDGFTQRNALLKLGYKFNKQFNIDFLSGYDYFDADFDGGAFFDSEDTQNSNQLRFGLSPTYRYDNGIVKLNVLYNTNEREFKGSFPVEYKGKNLQIDLTDKHEFSSSVSGLFGVNLQDLRYEEVNVSEFGDNQFTIFDPYASVFFESSSGLNIHAGARLNTHSEYGAHFIYNVNPSFTFGDNDLKLKIITSLSTAFVTPSLFQLFSFFGNDQLEPEESINYEGGVSLYMLNSKLVFNAVYFRRDEEEPIGFIAEFNDMGDFIGGQYANVANERTVDGVEVDIQFNVLENLNLKANYAHSASDNETTFYRIPNDKFGVTLDFKPLPKTDISLKYNFTGDREIFSFTSAAEVTLDSYQLVDLFVSQAFLDEKLSLFGSINNVFDEDFVAIEGFTTRGRNYSIGATYRF